VYSYVLCLYYIQFYFLAVHAQSQDKDVIGIIRLVEQKRILGRGAACTAISLCLYYIHLGGKLSTTQIQPPKKKKKPQPNRWGCLLFGPPIIAGGCLNIGMACHFCHGCDIRALSPCNTQVQNN